ncbi:hypothetical protein D3C73_601510 [compost metagenome]
MTANQLEYPILIYGATFAGLGMASSLGKQAIVVERTSLVGHEYVNSYRPGHGLTKISVSDIGQALYSELAERNIVHEDGAVHLPGISPVLFHFIRKQGLDVRLMTEITDVKPTEGGYEVQLYNTSGTQSMKVRDLIDTTSICSSTSLYNPSLQGKRINAILNGPPLEAPLGDPKLGYELVQGGFASEVYLQFKVDYDDNWMSARNKLHQLWMNRPEALRKWKMAAVADTFDIKVNKGPETVGSGWSWVPSCAYDNFMEAFEAGLSYVKLKQEVKQG